MNAARAYRRLKEVEEKKLANRIALLKTELLKSQSKIKDASSRVKEVRKHKKEVQKRNARKVEEVRRRELLEKGHQDINAKTRLRIDMIRRANAESVAAKKKAEAKEVNDDKLRHRQIVEAQRYAELQRNIKLREQIQMQKVEAKKKREDMHVQKAEMARQAFNEKIQLEAAKSAEAEKHVEAMEKVELDLIRQLEQAQSAQRETYETLEHELGDAKHANEGKATLTKREKGFSRR
jgi:hypothetical protein